MYFELTDRIIDACIAVHRALGPGLLESAYQICLAEELTHRGIPFVRQPRIDVRYRSAHVRAAFQPDFIVYDKIVLELKAVWVMHDVFKAQVRTYATLSNMPVGLLVNFNVPRLVLGLSRVKPYQPLNLPVSESAEYLPERRALQESGGQRGDENL